MSQDTVGMPEDVAEEPKPSLQQEAPPAEVQETAAEQLSADAPVAEEAAAEEQNTTTAATAPAASEMQQQEEENAGESGGQPEAASTALEDLRRVLEDHQLVTTMQIDALQQQHRETQATELN